MKSFTNKEFQLYKKVLKLTQFGVLRSMTFFLEQNYPKENVYTTEKFVLAIGNIPICVCAHADTVFPTPPTEVYYDREENVIWSPQGAGHDDRAGIMAIIQLISSGYHPHIIISTDEEIGCVGAIALSQIKCPFPDLRYIIQLDRRGPDDCVFYYNNNRDFVNYIESFGFVEAKGTFTDIVKYCPEWNVSGVNLSIGYEDEHTYVERLFVSHYFNTLNKVKKMLDNPPKKKFEYIPMPIAKPGSFFKKLSGKVCTCDKCQNTVSEEDVYPIKSYNHKYKDFCIDCMMEGVNWCVICNEPFECVDPSQSLCQDCRKEYKK